MRDPEFFSDFSHDPRKPKKFSTRARARARAGVFSREFEHQFERASIQNFRLCKIHLPVMEKRGSFTSVVPSVVAAMCFMCACVKHRRHARASIHARLILARFGALWCKNARTKGLLEFSFLYVSKEVCKDLLTGHKIHILLDIK